MAGKVLKKKKLVVWEENHALNKKSVRCGAANVGLEDHRGEIERDRVLDLDTVEEEHQLLTRKGV